MTKVSLSRVAMLGVAALAAAPFASAATVEYRLISDGPNSFKITALVTGADHAGISGYGVDLLGDITSLQHISPGSYEAQAGSATGPAGFTLARTGENQPYVSGIQNVADPSLLPIYGMGAQASSFAAEGITTLSASRSNEWDAELVVATGTYNGSFDSLGFDPYGPNTGANVFESVGIFNVKIPEIISFVRVADSKSEVLAVLDRLNPIIPAHPHPGPVAPPTPTIVVPPEIGASSQDDMYGVGKEIPPIVVPPEIGASDSSRATVEYRLVADGPNTFKVTALVSGSGHAGLSGYGFDLLGDVTSLQHVTPGVAEAHGGSATGPAGFTLGRNSDNRTFVGASQDVADVNLLPIYGMGVQSSSFAAEGITPTGSSTSDEWDAELVLATGTYNGSFDSLSFNPTGPNTGANVFESVGIFNVKIPEIITFSRVSESGTEVLAVLDRLNPTIPAPPDAGPVLPPSPPVVVPPGAFEPPVIFEPPAPPEVGIALPDPPSSEIPHEGPVDPSVWIDLWRDYSEITSKWRLLIEEHNGVGGIILRPAVFRNYDGGSIDVDVSAPTTLVTGIAEMANISMFLYGSSTDQLANADFDGVALNAVAFRTAASENGQLIPEPGTMHLLLAAIGLVPVVRWSRRTAVSPAR